MTPFMHPLIPHPSSDGGEGESPLWLVVLADMMTNLMLFFLIMYAYTIQGESAMKELERSLRGEKAQTAKEKKAEEVVSRTQEEAAAAAIRELFKDESVILTERQVRLKLPSPVLFESGKAELSEGVRKDLEGLGRIIASLPNEVVVEGHTDSVPMRSPEFASNYELSAARARAVVQFLSDSVEIPPSRFSVAGYGEFRPVAGNETPAGRAGNRRIEIAIMRQPK